MKDGSYITGPDHKPAQFWWGVVIGTLGGFVGCVPWQAGFGWHLLVALLVGVLFGILARSFGDLFWHAMLRVLRVLWRW